jgi:hypothetical protein
MGLSRIGIEEDLVGSKTGTGSLDSIAVEIRVGKMREEEMPYISRFVL